MPQRHIAMTVALLMPGMRRVADVCGPVPVQRMRQAHHPEWDTRGCLHVRQVPRHVRTPCLALGACSALTVAVVRSCVGVPAPWL